MVFIKSIITLSLAVAGAIAANVASISSCPALTARSTPAKDVTDLRIDDIKIVGAMGDSIMAGFAMMGVDYEGTGLLNLSLLSEYRGNSYAIGGDTGAVTIANFIKQFQPNVQGASVLSHIASICSAGECKFPTSAYRPLRDNLNGAQSGAIAANLDYELDYLIPRMKSMFLTTNYNNDWKLITIQIGSNDQCASCNSTYSDLVTADAYANYVEAAIKRIQAEVPKVVVNLLGTFKVSGVYPLTANQAYCGGQSIFSNKQECSCSSSPADLAKMDALSDAYNVKLKAIAAKYKGKANGTFAVMYNPAPIDISSFPVDALSNADCFHPSLKGHQWIAKVFWNELFTTAKPSKLTFDADVGVYCPKDSDRLQTA